MRATKPNRRVLVSTALLLLFATGLAHARPGGGQSYSGSGSSRGSSSGGSSSSGSSSSGSSSGGTAVPMTDQQVKGLTTVLLVLFAFVCLYGVWHGVRERRGQQEWDSSERRERRFAEQDRREQRHGKAELRRRDPEFSDSLFEDFARALYARAQQARHDAKALGRLAPYVSAPARRRLQQREPVGLPVQSVVIGTIKALRWLCQGMYGFAIDVEFEANLVLAEKTQYAHEIWSFQRSSRARTKPWLGTRTFGCPNCGAPLEKVCEELCASCGQQVPPARFDWTVQRIEVKAIEDRTASLTTTVVELGSDEPTVFDPDLDERRASLLRDDPAALEGLEARLRLVFAELNSAWAGQDLRPARAYLSSGLFATLSQQVESCARQGLVNEVVGPRITRFELAKVVRDPRQDSLTLRVFGTGCDVTYKKATGEVVAGSRSEPRPYSEYWTFIRSAKVRGAARADKKCPACAAPLDVGMEGNCEHCGVLVASGDFDWLLSGIEQDDSYRG